MNTRSRLALGLVLFGFSVSVAAQVTALDGTYTYAYLDSELDPSCSPSQSVVVRRGRGEVTFLTNGSFTMSETTDSACVPFASIPGSSTASGTYTLALNGDLVLDLNPSAPGTQIAEFVITADRQIFVGQEVLSGEPAILVGIRQSSGLDNAALDGAYAYSSLAQSASSGGANMTAAFGAVTFDGMGSSSASVIQVTIDSNGNGSSTPAVLPGSYTVLPTGELQDPIFQSTVGQITSDGRFGFMTTPDGPLKSLTLFAKEKGAPPTPGVFDGDWVLSVYGGENTLPGGEVFVQDSIGDIALSAGPGTFFLTGAADGVSNQFQGNITSTNTGVYSAATDGSFTINESGDPFVDDGWLAAREDVAIFGTLSNPDGVSLGLLLRRRGSFTADQLTLSTSLGGTQTLTFQANSELAGKSYVVLGSRTSIPGFVLNGVQVPLNYSGYLLFSLNNLNSLPFVNTFGTLDATGRATAQITIPPGVYTSAAGSSIHSCALVFDPPGFGTLLDASPVVPLTFTP